MFIRSFAGLLIDLRHAELFALIPVPLRNLVEGHVESLGNLDFQLVVPDRIVLEVLLEDFDLILILKAAATILFFVGSI